MPHVDKVARYGICAKADGYLLTGIECLFLASFAKEDQKLPFLERAGSKFDMYNFILRIANEAHILDDKKYAAIATLMFEIGRQLGGWRGKYSKKNHPRPRD